MTSLPEAKLDRRRWRRRWWAVWPALWLAGVAYLTYVHGYWRPPYFFWDENYHVAAAQRYLHGTFFMEPHPPLGKLFIALGEWLVSPAANGDSDQFIGTDHADETPKGFSLTGYRLFPTLFAWLISPLLYAIFYLLTRNRAGSVLLTLPYTLDNALIVHSRAAMLEPILELFVVLMILLFLLLLEWRHHDRRRRFGALAFGACLAAAVTTKVTGLVMVLLFLPLLWRLSREGRGGRMVLDVLAASALGFVVVFVAVWQIHFALGSKINPSLPEGGYYQASPEYKQVLAAGETGSILHFPMMLRDSMAFLGHYQKGVPKLDLCKSGENGSPWFLWPIGARAINYRWETPGGGESAPYHYLYLQSNPATWLLGLLGVTAAAALIAGSMLLPLRRPLRHRFMLVVFLGLWLAYMAAISRLDRVMYLYHYFLPLLFGLILFGLVVFEVQQIAGWRLSRDRRLVALGVSMAVVVGSFLFYSPLTYYRPITDAAFQRRSLVRLWNLHCVRCEPTDPLVRHSCS